MTEQALEMFTRQITQPAAGQRVVPSLELFQHVYASPQQNFRALMRSRAGEPLWEALQAALGRAIEPALESQCAENCSPPVPLPLVAQYLAGAFLTLLHWWVAADMPYQPEQMEGIFQQLAMPGVWAMLNGSARL